MKSTEVLTLSATVHYLESSTMLQIWYKGRGKILEPSASKNDKSAKKIVVLVVVYLDSNKSFLFLDPVTYYNDVQ